jgi:tetratricopeptide (TPR) repeat protein
MCQVAGAEVRYSARMIRLSILCLMLIGLGTVALAEDAPQVVQGQKLLDANKNQEALALLNTYLAQNPKDAQALVERGDAYEALNRYTEAAADYTAALSINPDFAYAYASRCESRENLDEYKPALADCDRALELDPKLAYALRERAYVNLDLNDVAAANVDADKAVEVDGEFAGSHGIQCRARWYADKFAEAATSCAAALQLDPKNYQGRFYSGRLAIHAADWKGAESMFSAILDDDSKDTGASYWRAMARQHLQENAGAMSDINYYISRYADEGDGYMVRARVEYQTHDLAAAKDDGATALRRYRIVNDTDSMAVAQKFLDDISAGKDPNAGA